MHMLDITKHLHFETIGLKVWFSISIWKNKLIKRYTLSLIIILSMVFTAIIMLE